MSIRLNPIIVFLVVWSIGFIGELHSQDCIPSTDQVYMLKSETANLRNQPSKGAKIITIIKKGKHMLFITNQDSIKNNFIKVKAQIREYNYEKESKSVIIESNEGWLSKDLVDFNNDHCFYTKDSEPEEGTIDDVINEELSFKLNNICTFNPSRLTYGYTRKGKILLDREEYIDAIRYFSNSIKEATANSQEEKILAIYYRGISKIHLHDYRGAIVDLNQLVTKGKQVGNFLVLDWDINYKNNGVYFKGSSYPMIVKEDLFYYLAFAYVNAKMYNDALKYSNLIITKNAQYASAYFVRGFANLKLKNKDSACLDFSKAGELGINEAYDYISQYCR